MHQTYTNSLITDKHANLRKFDKPQAKLDEKNDTVNTVIEIVNELERGDEKPSKMVKDFFKDSIPSTTEPEDMNAPQTRCKPLLSTNELRALKANRKFNKTSAKQYYKDTSSYHKTEFKKQKVKEKRNYWNILMEDPQEEKQQFLDDNYGYQNANRDVEMEEKQDDEMKARRLCDQIGQLCKYLKIDFKETTNDSIFDLEMPLDKLQCKKVLVQAFGSKSEMLETPQTKGKGPGSFHKDFITEAQHNEQIVKPKRVQFVDTKAPAKKLKETFHEEINTKLNVVTPVKGFEINDQSEEKSNDEKMLEKRCEKIREVITGIADELRVQIPETTKLSLMKGDLSYLQKELGGWSIRKREMLKAKKKAQTAGQQFKVPNIHDGGKSFVQKHAPLYDDSGLNVAAISMNVTPRAPKDRPPVVERIQKQNVKNGVNQIRHSYTVRLKLQQLELHVNVSQKLKEIFNVWKSADQSSILLAYDDENNSDLMIDDVNKIPYDEQEVNKYIQGMYQYNGKLHFSLRISGHQNLRHLKLHVFKWMRANNGFASIDRIKAAMVHTIEFFHSMHPDFYNREQFKIHVKEYLKPLEIGDDVNVFPRKTWMHHNGQKIETRALVLEVPKVHKDIVNEKMLQYQYRNCPNLTYVPFMNMQDEEHQKTMKQIFYSHNIYLHKIERRTVYGISYPTKKYELLNGDTSSFQEWVSTITYGGNEFLEACEIGPTGNLHLIYDEEHEKTVKLLFGNDFKSLARAHFKHNDVEEIFQKKQIAIEAKSRQHLTIYCF